MTARPVEHRLGWTRADRPGLLVLLIVAGAALAVRLADRDCPPTSDAEAADAVRQMIDPNTASAASLRRLPGIGPGLTRAVIDYREASAAQGRRPAFTSVDDLTHVGGIGPVRLARIRRHLTVKPAGDARP